MCRGARAHICNLVGHVLSLSFHVYVTSGKDLRVEEVPSLQGHAVPTFLPVLREQEAGSAEGLLSAGRRPGPGLAAGGSRGQFQS